MITNKKSRKKVTVEDRGIWFHDIEVFPNYTLFVFKNIDTKDYTMIEIHDRDNGDLGRFLSEVNGLIGYNCIGYDAQVIEFILRNPGKDVQSIKNFSDKVITDLFPPYKDYSLSKSYLDLMLVNNYGKYSAKATSLKHLSYFFRVKSVADTPFGFNEELTDAQKKEVIKYCLKDTDITEMLYNKTESLVEIREKLGEQEGLNLINSPEPKLAKQYFINAISTLSGVPETVIKNLRTYRKDITGKSLILPYIKFKTKFFQDVKEFYEGVKLHPTIKSKVNPAESCIILKNQLEYCKTLNGTEYNYKGGGLHACYERGIYESNDKFIIEDIDYVSFYPRLGIVHKFSPAHIDTKIFVGLLQGLFDNRTKFNKKTHFAMNYAYKILINIVYGLSNSEHGPFYDAEYTLKTCINGMLTISMLIESVTEEIPHVTVLQANTDGITIMYPRDFKNKLTALLKKNEEETGMLIERAEYKKMVIYDVNNYLAVPLEGDIKQKGIFETWETMDQNGWYHKDPSMNIRAIALNDYFVKGIPVENTVNGCNNIQEFLLGAKGNKSFKWLINSLGETGVISSELSTARIIRYFVGGNSSISKMWLKDKTGDEPAPSGFTLLNASQPVTMCQTIMSPDISKKEMYSKLNRQYYIDETNKIIRNIQPF